MKQLTIRKERLLRKWTLEFVAKSIGVKKSTIQMIESGQRKPSYEVLVKLEDLFGKTHRELFAEVKEPNG